MKSLMLAVTIAGALLTPAVAAADRPGRDGRYDAKAIVARIDRTLERQRLASRPVEVEYSTPSLARTPADQEVDARIRRMGELIRRAEREAR